MSFSSFHQHLGPTQPTFVAPFKALSPIIQNQQQQGQILYAASAVAPQQVQSSYLPQGYAKSYQYRSPAGTIQPQPAYSHQHATIAAAGSNPVSTAIYNNQPQYQTVHYGTHLYQPGNAYSRINYGIPPKY